MDISCTKEEEKLFERIANAAEALGVSCYIVGGFVRDKLLEAIPAKMLMWYVQEMA